MRKLGQGGKRKIKNEIIETFPNPPKGSRWAKKGDIEKTRGTL
jgi:hypothetical protein